MDFYQLLPELVYGLILGAFAWAFNRWADTLRRSSQEILAKLEKLGVEFHKHKIENENRMTRVEAELKAIEKNVERIDGG